MNSHQGYGDFQQKGGKSWLFFDDSLSELWRKQPVTSSDSVRKTVILEKCFLLWNIVHSKVQASAFVFVMCCSIPLAEVCLNQQILQLCLAWDLQGIMLCLLDPTTVLCVKSNVGLGSLFLAAHWHLQSWLRSVARSPRLYAIPLHSCFEGDVRSLWPQGTFWVPQNLCSQLLAIHPSVAVPVREREAVVIAGH